MAAAVLAAAAAAQQFGAIRGTVVDREFGVPVADAQVALREDAARTVRTDERGGFSLQQVPPGSYTLVVSKDGYLRDARTVVVTAGQLVDAEVSLGGDFTDMDQFVVNDVLRLAGDSEGALTSLRLESPALVNAIGADLMSRAGASDAASALRLVSGASLQNGKSAVIRGLPDRYVSSQINGVRVPSSDEDKRAVELDQFPAEVISSIQVTKTFTPDQFADASGGAVDVRLKGVPDEPFLAKWKMSTSHNTQVTGRNRFLSYEGGGLGYWGGPTSSRGEQELGENWDGAVGVREVEAPIDYKWSGSLGGRFEVARGVRLGGTANFFYEHDTEFDDRGVDDSWVGSTNPGQPLTPEVGGNGTAFTTSLLDIKQGKQSVQWGGLGTIGIESDEHAVSLIYLFTRSYEDTATLAEDTRGKQYFFPGYDPNNVNTPGHSEAFAAPYLRYQTIDYTERRTSTLQLSGHHRFPQLSAVRRSAVEVDWTVAHSTADRSQPDRRFFAERWIDGTYLPLQPAAAFTLGWLQRTYKELSEESDQATVGIKVPFTQWGGEKGYLKVGVLADDLDRSYDQNTFSNFNLPGQPPQTQQFDSGFDQLDWSDNWQFEDHPITASATDVDYKGRQRILGTYVMADLPLTKTIDVIGGVRWENSHTSVVLSPESGATWLPEGQGQETSLTAGDADVHFASYDVLPSAAIVFRPLSYATLRTSYAETIARQTFKELTPILNQEYLGGPIFIGNPDLQIAHLRNYDVRLDLTPIEGGLFSVSWFKKDIEDPIEYVSRAVTFSYTTAINYPRGHLSGWEVEARQELGTLVPALRGLAVGGNSTWIDGRVNLPDSEILRFEQVYNERPRPTRDLTGAPEFLYNLFTTYTIEATGTQFGIFYTRQGDTLVAGASAVPYIPATYRTEFDTLNLTLSQKLGANIGLTFAAKNLTDSEQREVYRSDYVGGDVLRRLGSDGIEYSLTLGGEIRF